MNSEIETPSKKNPQVEELYSNNDEDKNANIAQSLEDCDSNFKVDTSKSRICHDREHGDKEEECKEFLVDKTLSMVTKDTTSNHKPLNPKSIGNSEKEDEKFDQQRAEQKKGPRKSRYLSFLCFC